jgi:hypothetical protein
MDLHQLITDIKEKVDLIYGAMIGDPLDQDKPGFLMRLDRVENSFRFFKKMCWLMFSAIVGTIGTLVVKILL